MAKVIDNNRQGRGQPTIQKQAENRKKCDEAFDKGWSALYAAKQLKLNRLTVMSYYKDLKNRLIEDLNESFLLRQKTAKEQAIYALDDDINEFTMYLNDIDDFIKRDKEPHATWSNQRLIVMKEISDLKQKKFAIEMSPTIEVSLEQMAEEIADHAEQFRSKADS